MLAASWSLLRHASRRTPAQYRPAPPLPPLSHPVRPFTASRQPSYNHSAGRGKRTPKHSKNFVELGYVTRSLVRAIKRGRLGEADDRVQDFLVSLRDDEIFPRASFLQVKAAIQRNPKSCVPLTVDLGRGLIELGFDAIVEEELMPIVREWGTKDDMMRLCLELQEEEEEKNLPKRDVGKTKAKAASLPAVENPSVEAQVPTFDLLSLLGDKPTPESVEAQYPDPSPPVKSLSEMLEDYDDEYDEFKPSHLNSHSSNQSNGVLVSLVKQRNFAKAYVLLTEMKELGTPIKPSVIYLEPALSALRKSAKDGDRLATFTSWFSLIPPKWQIPISVDFSSTALRLLQANTPVSFLIEFSLILTRKGFGQQVTDILVPYIIRASLPTTTSQFVGEFEGAIRAYWDDARGHVLTPTVSKHKVLSNFRGIVIRTLAYIGRPDEALAILPNPDKPEFRISVYTYNVLLKRLWMRKVPNLEDKIRYVKRLRSTQTVALQTKQAPISEDLRLKEFDETEIYEGETAAPVDFGDDLVGALRYLKKHIANLADRTQVAHPFTLVNFMSTYLSTGRTKALELLLRKAIRSSFFAVGNFVFAEMLFYRRLRQPQLVIRTFVDHFYLSGVPPDEVNIRYKRLEMMYNNYDPTSGEIPPLRRFIPMETLTLPRGKLWPRRVHTSLVWDALCKLNTDDRTVVKLYAQLVHFALHASFLPELGAGDVYETSDFSFAKHWGVPVGKPAFTAFIHPLMYIRGPGFGVRILRDILQCGHYPNVYHYTQLASFYAKRGDVERVMLVLNGMESELVVRTEDNPDLPKGRVPPILVHKMPAPTAVTYTAILRGFLIARHMEGAEETFRKYQKSGLYLLGQSRVSDLAVQDLEDFRREGDNWIYPYGRQDIELSA